MNFALSKFWVRVFWMVAVSVVLLASLSPALAPPSVWDLDKVMHFSAFGALAAIVPFAAERTSRRLLLLVVLLGVGGGIEILQEFVPGRSASLLDFAADTAGLVVGATAGLWFHRHLPAFLRSHFMPSGQ